MSKATAQALEVPSKPVAVVPPSTTLIDLLRAAVDKGADVATLERLAKLYEAAELAQQKKEFNSALADAKADLRPIIKDKEVQRSGGGQLYRYESMAAIAEAVDPTLAKHGLFYTFPDSEAGAPDGKITVTCRLSHRNGYSIEATRSAPPDVGQNRNQVQAMGSTITYLQRYTLKAVLGLAVSQDKDGSGPKAARPEIKTPAQDPGHVMVPEKPEQIPIKDGMLWQDWTQALLLMISKAPTVDAVEGWQKANAAELEGLLTDIPQHHAFVIREITKRIRNVRGKVA